MSAHRRAMMSSAAERRLDALAQKMWEEAGLAQGRMTLAQLPQKRLDQPEITVEKEAGGFAKVANEVSELLHQEMEQTHRLEGQLQEARAWAKKLKRELEWFRQENWEAVEWMKNAEKQLEGLKAHNQRLEEMCVDAGRWAMDKGDENKGLRQENAWLRAKLADAGIQVVNAPDYDNLISVDDDLVRVGNQILAQFKK